MKKTIYLMLIAIVASSCKIGYWVPNAQNHFGAQTTVVLDKANFRVVKNVEAVIEVNNTNLRRSDVEKSAYAELLRKADLTGSQVLTNVIVDEVRRETWGFFRALFDLPGDIKQYVAARATVIEFVDENHEPIPSVSVYAQPTQTPQPIVQEMTTPIDAEPTQTPQPVVNPTQQTLQPMAQETTTPIDAEPTLHTDTMQAKKVDYEINIPDKVFRAAILKRVDTNKDGKITKSEAMAVTTLNVSGKGITNMQGIEEFENLKKLNAQYNKFSTIDLSNNIQLREIWCSSDYIKSVVLKVKPISIDVPVKYITYK